MCCHKVHVFCREFILECFLAQKKDIQRRLAAHASQKKQDKDEVEERLMLQRRESSTNLISKTMVHCLDTVTRAKTKTITVSMEPTV